MPRGGSESSTRPAARWAGRSETRAVLSKVLPLVFNDDPVPDDWQQRATTTTTAMAGEEASNHDGHHQQHHTAHESPYCCGALMQWLYYSQVQPGDDVAVRTRKLIFAMSPVLGGGAALQWLRVPAAFLTDGEVPASLIATCVAVAVGVVIMFAHFFLARRRGANTALLSDTWIAGTACASVVVGLAQPEVTAAWFFAYFMLVAISFRSPRMPVLLGALFVVFGALEYNTAALMSCGDLPLVTLPWYDKPGPFMQIFIRCTHLAAFAAVLIVVNMPRREAERLHGATLAANALVADIAIALSRYDTAAAELKLREARGAEEADAAMLEALDGIVANLRRYRPHLPNWLLPASQRRPAAAHPFPTHGDTEDCAALKSDDPGEAPETQAPTRSASTRGTSSPVVRSPVVPNPLGESVREAAAQEDSPAVIEMIPAAPLSPEGRPPRPVPDASGKFTSRRRRRYSFGASARAPVLGDPAATDGTDNVSVPPTPRRSRVVLARIGFKIPRAVELKAQMPPGSITGAEALVAVGAAANAFVDRVHALAAATGAALHSFIADTVTVTWNAASVEADAEVKAARFLSRLKQDPGHELVTAWGALAVGDAQVQMAGLGQQQALTVSVDFADTADRLAAFAQRHQAFVCDAAVRHATQGVVHTRGVGLVSNRGETASAPSAAGSLLSSVNRRAGHSPVHARQDDAIDDMTDGGARRTSESSEQRPLLNFEFAQPRSLQHLHSGGSVDESAALQVSDSLVASLSAAAFVAAFEVCGELPSSTVDEADALLTAATEALVDGDRPRAVQCAHHWVRRNSRAMKHAPSAVSAFIGSLLRGSL